jgi:hypothetical protein
MLHARIRTTHDAFHFIAEVNAYNLQTLRQHVRQSLREDGQLTISMRIDPSDQRAFERYTAPWLPALIESGTPVELNVVPREP